MTKRKMTTKQRLNWERQRAEDADHRRQGQVANQLKVINRLLLLQKAMQDFMASVDENLLGLWEAHLAHVTSSPCAICKDPMNHYGLPHGEVTGDGMTRADAAAAATEPDPVGSAERDAGAAFSPAGPTA